MSTTATHFFPAALIARADRVSKITIVRRAAREAWSRNRTGNRFEFTPPRALLAKCRRLAGQSVEKPASALVGFNPLPRDRAFMRACAVEFYLYLVRQGKPIEKALKKTAVVYNFHTSVSTLRQWVTSYERRGFQRRLRG